MKKPGNRGIVTVMGFLLACMLGVSPAKAQGNVSFQVFYDELQPYGTWIHHNQHGYVWMPRVDRGFMPYATNGYWITTEYGNTWVSDYSWGWAPFHYGRWFYDDFYGWMWVPDTMWGPAWVAWRSGGGYYGWAPLMPGFSVGVSYNYYSGIPHSYWSFVPYRYITYRAVYRHCVPRPQVVKIINHTTIVTNNYTDNRRRTYFTGPSRREIERTTQERVRTYSVNDQSRPGRTAVERDRVSFYKPEIDDSNAARSNSMPSRYMRDNGSGKLEQVEARRERTSESNRESSLQNDLQRKQEQRSMEPNGANTDRSRNLDQMERLQQRDMQRGDDAFEPFKMERENPSRQVESSRAGEIQKPGQRNNDPRDEQLRSNNNEGRRQQLEKQNEALQEQRNLQRQRDNTVREQRNNENSQRQQSERQNPQREPGSPNERRAQERQPQSLQRMERPAQDRVNRSNSNPERQRPGSQQEIRKGTSDQKGGAPSKSQGGSNSPRRNN